MALTILKSVIHWCQGVGVDGSVLLISISVSMCSILVQMYVVFLGFFSVFQ